MKKNEAMCMKMIIVGWNSDLVDLNMVYYGKQSVLCKMEAVKGDLSMFCTIVYDANGGNERLKLWKDLRLHSRVLGSYAWAILGDLNATLDPKEHSFGSSAVTKDMIDFKECVNDIEVDDVTSYGLFFTWTKNLFKTKSGESVSILKKLDRVMGNESLISKYPQDHAIFLPYLVSDHCLVVLAIPNSLQTRRKAFRFANFAKIDENASNKMLREEESNILASYSVAIKDEEQLLFQKAKIKWLSVGDRNNAYFHKVLKSRNHKNRVNAIHDESGRRFEGDQVAQQFVKHFQNFLGNSTPMNKRIGTEELFKCKLSIKEAAFMVREVSSEEIKKTIFQIDDNKAPSPDGFTAHFYKKSWGIIGEDVCNTVKDFLPIAYCNVIFKCISNVIIERIKECLGRLVSQNQSAFIPSRQIQDNIMISQELLKGYDRKDGPKRVTLKINLQKAYDTVNWNFLEDTLNGFGFQDKMVMWIMQCATTTSFSVIVNGESQGYFKGGRDLRQGDPMSPYLFTLIMKVLNLLLKRRIDNINTFQYHFGCRKLKITHICFADDILMFSHGDKASVKLLKDTIENLGKFQDFSQIITKVLLFLGVLKEMIGKRFLKLNKDLSWKNKCLSYAGRLQLVASVLESIHVYWAIVFVLPQTVIDEINSILKGFLWSQEDKTNG
ncbi:RNA-directed DNA polymerase, eukaryota, reverse transcriptase zinc-binding domain protein, partial [Tanacetum coccineum]